MNKGLVFAAVVMLVAIAAVQAQDTTTAPARTTTAPAPTTAPTTAASATTTSGPSNATSRPHTPENDKLIEIKLDKVPPIPAMRVNKLFKNIDQFKLSVAYFTSKSTPPAQETAKFVVVQGEGDKPDAQKKVYVSQVTRHTASELIQALLVNGFLDNAANLKVQHPQPPEESYLIILEGMGTTDLYQVLPFNKETLDKLEEIRTALDADSIKTLDKAIKRIQDKRAELK